MKMGKQCKRTDAIYKGDGLIASTETMIGDGGSTEEKAFILSKAWAGIDDSILIGGSTIIGGKGDAGPVLQIEGWLD